MFDHVTISASDLEASRRFYNTVLSPLRLPSGHERWLRLLAADGKRGATSGLHIAFVTRSRDEVNAFWQAGVDAGHESDGEPGPRPIYSADYYGGFLLDPDGNSAEAVHLGRAREGECAIDHLWIRVADLDASRRFWDAVAPALGLTIYGARRERFHVGARDRSFALVHDGHPVTRNVELGFPVTDGSTDLIELRDPDGNRIVPVA
jgi:catechol 2,3-dioxygenase-like lactoylglutathione lyase family enzyme